MSESLFKRYEIGERSQSHSKKYKKFECKLTYDDDYEWRQRLMRIHHDEVILRRMSDEAFDSLFSQVLLYGSGTILFDL